jgi:hypothetical protein
MYYMKKRMLSFILGTFFGVTLSIGSVTFAANTDLLAKVTNLKIVVNGQEKSLSEKPVVINNKTYLPVRDIGNVTGYNVDYKSGVVSLDNTNSSSTLSNDNNSSTDISNNNSIKEFKKLPITVTNGNISVTVNSVSLGEYSTDFNVTVINNSSEDIQVRYDFNGLGANWNVEGKKYQVFGTIAEKNEFSSPVKAGTTVTGTIRKSKVDEGTENLLFHLMINGKGFSFYIDTKGIL